MVPNCSCVQTDGHNINAISRDVNGRDNENVHKKPGFEPKPGIHTSTAVHPKGSAHPCEFNLNDTRLCYKIFVWLCVTTTMISDTTCQCHVLRDGRIPQG